MKSAASAAQSAVFAGYLVFEVLKMNTLKITRLDGSTHETVPLKLWRQRCRCECETGGPCEHDFSGPVVYTQNSGSVVCSHCGMTAMAHDIKLF